MVHSPEMGAILSQVKNFYSQKKRVKGDLAIHYQPTAVRLLIGGDANQVHPYRKR